MPFRRRRRVCMFEESTVISRQQIKAYNESLPREDRSVTMIQNNDASIEGDDRKSSNVLTRGMVLDEDNKMMEEDKFDDSLGTKVFNERRTWTVGKLSLVMLVLFSLTDVLLNLVDAQMDFLEAPDYHDALSADVTRPAFRYHTSGHDRADGSKRMGLGSATISSVTSALSPILPFTGGIDLRREDYWTDGLFGSVSSVVEQVRSAFAGQAESTTALMVNPRGGAKTAQRTSKSLTRGSREVELSNSNPFVSLNDIAKLTLKEVSLTFRYAVESTRIDFNLNKFMSGVSARTNEVFTQISEASAKSRGRGVKIPKTGAKLVPGDIDALHFCASMRIFAEWRVLGQVPDGYKGYSVGMNLGQKDIVQNVGKIEKAVHDWIEHQYSIPEGANLSSPTLRELLQFEADIGLHDNLPRLKEKSAAMGLLWVRRQLHYQTALFANVIQVPGRFETARAAISAAYNEVYDKYHGWAVQKIFTYSFQAAPDTTEVYKVMNPEKLKEVTKAAEKHASLGHINRISVRGEDLSPLKKLGRNIGREWDNFLGGIGNAFGNRHLARGDNIHCGSEDGDTTALKVEQYINEQMEHDAHEHIVAYLEVAKPILDDLAALFDEFNMDDPTKV